MTRFATLVAVYLLLFACASAETQSSGGRNPSRISAEEIGAAQVSNAYELVQQLRPEWLRARSSFQSTARGRLDAGDGSIVVLLNGSRYGDVSSLRQISVGLIGTIEYLGPGEVQQEFTQRSGQGVVGAIVIRTHRER